MTESPYRDLPLDEGLAGLARMVGRRLAAARGELEEAKASAQALMEMINQRMGVGEEIETRMVTEGNRILLRVPVESDEP